MHFGLIGGIGPAATEFYYRNMVKIFKEHQTKLELTITHADTATLVSNMVTGEKAKQAQVFLTHINRLQAAGCDMVVVTSMAGHFCIDELIEISPLPILNIVPILDRYFVKAGIKKIGLIGSEAVMTSKIYGGIPSIEVLLPDSEILSEVSSTYFRMAKAGFATEEQRTFFHTVGQELYSSKGAETVVLGGTDLFLAFEEQDSSFPVLDCALVHIEEMQRLAS
ncbi:MAG: aspartate/glutamate racemase family protein [Kordiimonas sp.]